MHISTNICQHVEATVFSRTPWLSDIVTVLCERNWKMVVIVWSLEGLWWLLIRSASGPGPALVRPCLWQRWNSVTGHGFDICRVEPRVRVWQDWRMMFSCTGGWYTGYLLAHCLYLCIPGMVFKNTNATFRHHSCAGQGIWTSPYFAPFSRLLLLIHSLLHDATRSAVSLIQTAEAPRQKSIR